MELKKYVMQSKKAGKQVTNQFMLDDDFNVPDQKPDVKRIVLAEGELKIEEIKRVENYLRLSGKFVFQVLYITDEGEERMASLEGHLPFDEMVYTEGEEGHFQIQDLKTEFSVMMVHSRKLSMKAMIDIALAPINVSEEEITVGLEEEENFCQQRQHAEFLQMQNNKKDTYRIKEEITIPGTKENIGNILWSDIKNHKLDTRLSEDALFIQGELLAFCFYESMEGKLDWIEKSIPYEGRVECAGASDEMFHHVEAQLEDVNVDIRMDEDGEARILGIEGTLSLKIAVYKEEPVEYLNDVYALHKKCIVERQEKTFSQMVMQNHSKCKIAESVPVPELKDKILQICHSSGRLALERMERVDGGILVEGTLHINFLYVKQDDEIPFDIWQGMVPFSHLIECNDMDGEVEFDVSDLIEQLNINLLGSDETEVKAVLAFRCFVRRPVKLDVITEVTTEDYTKEEMEMRPGITGYIVKQGDQLWDLAKRYGTTVETIKEMNDVGEREIKEGDKLLIFKESMSIL